MSLPAFTLTLSPRPDGIDVRYVVQTPTVPAGRTLCRVPRVIAGIPGVELATADLHLSDALGELPLTEEDEPATPSYTYRRWTAARDTSGDLTVSYFAPVRQVDAFTQQGPLFDLRAEAGGVYGAGLTFLVLPTPDAEYRISVRWTCRSGERAVASFGEGDTELTGTAECLAYAFYMAGPVSSHPEHAGSPFSMYWLTEPTFDPVAVATHIQRIYDVMCGFFREPDPGHRVFVRKQPHPGSGGTGLPRSFFFGYGDDEVPTVEGFSALLAHETAHNWPILDGDHGETSWYSEGTAEYYSIVLPHRAGILDDDEFLRLINERAQDYYTNPLQTLTSAQAAEIYWKDQRAQRVPYGRGLFYLIDVNAKILAASDGERSLDDLVLAVLDRQRAGEKVGVSEWLELVRAELGEAGLADFEALNAGSWVVPAPDALGPGFTRIEEQEHVTDAGFDLSSLSSRVVTGLVPGSAAEQAGLREGDVIVKAPAAWFFTRAARKPAELTLSRGRETVSVTYEPKGGEARSYRWVPVGQEQG